MDIKSLVEKIRHFGLDADKTHGINGFPYDIITKEEMKVEGEGWIIQKASILGYYLIQYGERSMSLNYC
jgi:hypothetical protein